MSNKNITLKSFDYLMTLLILGKISVRVRNLKNQN